MERSGLAAWIHDMLQDQYYSTVAGVGVGVPAEPVAKTKLLINRYRDRFTTVETGLIFGTVAVRYDIGFVTTGRGKHELDSIAFVFSVNHRNREVLVSYGGKASLNAPLLARMFENPRVHSIVHYHAQEAGLPTYEYAPPGTVRDSNRPNHTSFNIKEHGCMLLFDEKGRRL
jgi:hypothetical protein